MIFTTPGLACRPKNYFYQGKKALSGDTVSTGSFVYSNNENLVLWARSEKIGCAVILHSGIMEYWSVGIMGLAE